MQHPQAVGEVFNIGGEKEITIDKLALLVKTLTQSCSEIRYIPYSEAYEEGFEDIPRRVPDLSKIRCLLDYRPSHGLGEIVHDVIECFQQEAHV